MRTIVQRIVSCGVFCLLCFAVLEARCIAESSALPEQREPDGQFFNANGKKLWFRVEGSGPPLVLVPGGPGFSHRRLLPYFAPLAAEVTLVYFDPFGRGKSSRAANPDEYSVDRDIRDLEALRLELGAEKIHLFGHSYGALVVEGYAVKYPEHVRSLTLASGVMSAAMWQQGPIDRVNREVQSRFPDVWKKLQSILAQGRTSRDPEYQTAMGDVWGKINIAHRATGLSATGTIANGPTSAVQSPPVSDVPVPLGADDWSPDVYFSLLGDDPELRVGGKIAQIDYSEALKKLRMPVLLTFGRHDISEPSIFAEAFQKSIPQSKLVVFEHSGHSPHAEESEQYRKVLAEFLRLSQ